MKIVAIRDISDSYVNTLVSYAKEINPDVILYDFKKKSKNIAKQYGFPDGVDTCGIVDDLYNIGVKYHDRLWIEQFKRFTNKGYFKNRVLIVKNFSHETDTQGLLDLGAIILCSIKKVSKAMAGSIIPVDIMTIDDAREFIRRTCVTI